ncbi:MAG TPA: type II toxin-antitoxin system VapC family toxin [Actinomycetales bacterium]|nr:type II toxin-antitoxin system VapC family toxin [Actinomycetales bacterium]
MIVVDASLLVDALVGGSSGDAAQAALGDGDEEVAAPAVLPAEALSGVRSLMLRKVISRPLAMQAVSGIASLRIPLYPFEPFVERVWELRDNVTVYDAWYVALAEALDVPLLTADRRLAETPGARCEVRLVR